MERNIYTGAYGGAETTPRTTSSDGCRLRSAISIGLLAVSALVTVGCSSGPESEFMSGLREKYAQERVCLYSMGLMSGSSVGEANGETFVYKSRRTEAIGPALLEAGLVSAPKQIETGPRGRFSSAYAPTVGYPVTAHGAEFISKSDGICVGRWSVPQIEEWTEPNTQGGMTISMVSFVREFEPYDWFQDSDRPGGMPDRFEDRTTEQAVFIKTNKGWRLQG